MKSEERHQLQQNELAKLGTRMQDVIKHDFWDKYSNHILIGVSVICLGLAAWIYWSRTTQGAETRAWREMSRAQEVADYATIADSTDFSGTSVVPWAALKAAELRLSDGIRGMFTDREKAAADLEQARGRLEELLERAPQGELKDRALFLLGQTLETQGQVEEAAKRYEQLLGEFKNSPHRQLVEARLAAIKSGEAKEFYAWFSKQKPKPVEPPKPKDEEAGTGPSLLDGLQMPEFRAPLNETPATEEKTTEEKTTEEKPSEEKSSGEKPAAEKPGEDKPTEKPTDEPSAAEKPKEPVESKDSPKTGTEPDPKSPEKPSDGDEKKPEGPALPTPEKTDGEPKPE